MTWQSEIQLSAALNQSSFFALDKISLAVRDQYPELKGLFDRYDDMTDDILEAPDQAEYNDAVGREQQMEVLVDEAAARFAQLRDMTDTLLQMDASKGIVRELRQLANLADEAQEYMEKQR